MGSWWDEVVDFGGDAVDTVSDFFTGGGGSGVTDSWMTETQNAVYNKAGAASDWGMSDIFNPVASALGSSWEWMTKNPTVLGGVVGAGTAILNSQLQGDSPSEIQADYLNKRRKQHNEGITKAAKRYQ